jgi:hypothetical protein
MLPEAVAVRDGTLAARKRLRRAERDPFFAGTVRGGEFSVRKEGTGG